MRIFLGIITMAALAGSLVAGTDRLNFGKQLNAAQCNAGGKMVINVVQHITNDEDSAVGGNYWAFDDFNRQIQVWQTAPNTFCAVVSYHGSFTTVAGPSPNGTGLVAAGVKGTIEGG